LLAGVGPAAAAPQDPVQDLQLGSEVWPKDFFSDLPALDLTGTWTFDAADSDPMLSDWAEHEVIYEVTQHSAYIVLDFRVPGIESNTQRYRWDSQVEHFERGGRNVEEAARWTRAGSVLEVIGRHWNPATPNEREEYRFTYEVRGDQLIFVQSSDSGSTTWRFSRVRDS
jgi:hypothetical protein